METKSIKKITKKIFIKGKITTLTGLHIGGTETGINIGGLDKGAVIRDSISDEPYIPGSSIKGKMRSLLEKLKGEYEIDMKTEAAGPSTNPETVSAKIFGISADEKKDKKNDENGNHDEQAYQSNNHNDNQSIVDRYFRASRLIVRDAFLTPESREKLINANLELPFTEVKTETSIDRVTSKANPRSIERVPRDSEFDFDMILSVYEDDKEEELTQGLFTAMRLLQEDYLGGHGSRGSGKISITIDSITEKTDAQYKSGDAETPSKTLIPGDFKPKPAQNNLSEVKK